MQKFLQSNLVTDFICNILYQYWLPTYETVKVGDYIVKDELYIYNTNVIKCTESGYIGGSYYQQAELSAELVVLRPTEEIEKPKDYTYKYILDPETNLYVGKIDFFRVPTKDIEVNLNGPNNITYQIYGDDKTTIYYWYPISRIANIQINGNILSEDLYYWQYDNTELKIKFFTPVTLDNTIYIVTEDNYKIRLYCKSEESTYILYSPPERLEDVTTYTTNILDLYKQVATYDIIQSYSFGQRFRKFTDNYIANSSYYNTSIHERLGKFIQVYSDLTGTDLRPYYNFNSQHYINNIYINRRFDETTNKVSFDILDETTTNKILIFPVRFNHTYTIALDSALNVTVAPIFLTQQRKLLISNGTDVATDISQEFLNESKNTYYFSSMSVTNPQYVEFTCTDDLATKYYKYRKNLYMLIQMPNIVDTSITVLEGKFKNLNSTKIVECSKLYKLSEVSLNKILTSKLTLLQLNTKVSYPFSNRLLEYLFDCVIDYNWKLDGNIEKAQALLTNSRIDEKELGIWDNLTRYRFYSYAMKHPDLSHTDINGNIDKDTEKGLIKSTLNINGDF